MQKKEKYNVAIVGATGLVGEHLLEILEERDFPVDNLYPLASSRSLGKTVSFKGQEYAVLELDSFDFEEVDFAFFSAGASVSRIHAVRAASQGSMVIDNTSEFRMQDSVPLVVPECNPGDVHLASETKIIANPNCSTIQMVVALKPIHDAYRVKRVNVATYQATSGAGRSFMELLESSSREMLSGVDTELGDQDHPVAFNVVPKIDVFQDNGYTKEEMKMVNETKKILHDNSILVNPTCVRVPVFYGHSEALHIETEITPNIEQVIEMLDSAPGIKLINGLQNGQYPTPKFHGAGNDAVYVGRVRQDVSCKNGLNLWVVSDNIRKGAALNSIQIAELLLN